MGLSVFNFDDFGSFLNASMEERSRVDRRYSYRYMARKISGCTHSALIMIAQGTRLPSDDLLVRICEAFEFSDEERAYAKALVGRKRAQSIQEKAFYEDTIRRLGQMADRCLIEGGLEEYIGDWRNVLVLEMTNLADFKEDPEWIAGRMGHGTTPADVVKILTLLKRLGLLRVADNGHLVRSEKRLATLGGVPSEVVRKFHRDQLEKAAKALDEQAVDKRFFVGTTFSIDASRLKESFELIEEFRHRFIALMQSGQGTETYHLAVQLYSLTHEVTK